MAEAKFPLYGANLRDAAGATLPNFKDRALLDFNGVRIGLTGLAYEQSPRMSSPEDLRFGSTIDTTKAAGRGAARRTVRTSSARSCIAIAAMRSSCNTSASPSCCSPATRTTCCINYDDKCALVESGYDAHDVTCVDVDDFGARGRRQRTTTWRPQFRVIDTTSVTPDPEVAAAVAKLEAALIDKMSEAICHHGGRARLLAPRPCARARPRSAICSPTRCAPARARTRRCSTAAASAPARPMSRARASRRATCWPNCRSTTASSWSRSAGRDLKRAMENGLSLLPRASGRFPQVSGIELEFDLAREAGNRITAMRVGGAPLDEGKMYRVARPRLSGARRRRLHDVRATQSASRRTTTRRMMVNEVVEYLRRIGTVAAPASRARISRSRVITPPAARPR